MTRGPSPSPPVHITRRRLAPGPTSSYGYCYVFVFRDDPARRVAFRVFAGLSTVEYPSPYGLRRDAVHEPIPSRRGHAHE